MSDHGVLEPDESGVVQVPDELGTYIVRADVERLPRHAELEDHTRWPGHEWVWNHNVGRCGRWVRVEDYWLVYRDDVARMRELLLEQHRADPGATIVSLVADEVARLRARIAELEGR